PSAADARSFRRDVFRAPPEAPGGGAFSCLQHGTGQGPSRPPRTEHTVRDDEGVPMTGQQMTGAEALVESLKHAGAEVVFGLPGGAILPTYDPLMDAVGLRHILVRHEQGAAHAASGYAHATGKVGVCLATSGPGATNLSTAIADAQMDSIPLVAIPGQVASTVIGTDAFQEADIQQVIKQRLRIASTGRPGALLVAVTTDAQKGMTESAWPQSPDLPGYRPDPRPHNMQIREAPSLLMAAERPVFLLGGGATRG